MRGHRHEWDMSFACNGADALDQMARSPAAVIVSDMRMPGIDGPALLGRVQAQWPDTIRIVLSGYADTDAAMRSVLVAHQVLCKPCEPADLTATLVRACAIRALLRDERLRRRLGGVEALPSLPRIYREASRLLATQNPSFDELAALVREDPAVCSKVLHLVNSSFFGLARTLTSVRDAVAYLGLTRLRRLLLSVAIFREAESCQALSVETEQLHAIMTGQLASAIVRDQTLADDAFVAGMLHDMGRLIIATRLPDLYHDVVNRAAATGKSEADVELDVLGVGHAEVGAYVLGIWGLPPNVVEAVAFHHAPERSNGMGDDVLTAVHVADALVTEVSRDDFSQSRRERPVLNLAHVAERGMAGDLETWRAMVSAKRSEG